MTLGQTRCGEQRENRIWLNADALDWFIDCLTRHRDKQRAGRVVGVRG